MSYNFTLKFHNENSVKFQGQDSFHVKNSKINFEIQHQIFAPNVVQTII